jgi:hypothetical protein
LGNAAGEEFLPEAAGRNAATIMLVPAKIPTVHAAEPSILASASMISSA